MNCKGCWARKRWKQKSSKSPWRSPGGENGLRPPLLPGGRSVKLVSECLGLARSQLTVRIKQSASPKVRRSRPVNDVDLVLEIQQQVSELPSYGYRHVRRLLRRVRENQLLPAINVSEFTGSYGITTCCLNAGSNSPACRFGTKAVLPCKPAIRVGARTALSSAARTAQN